MNGAKDCAAIWTNWFRRHSCPYRDDKTRNTSATVHAWALHARGVRDVEMGWILEDNDGMRNIIETIGGVAYKRYRVYQKEL